MASLITEINWLTALCIRTTAKNPMIIAPKIKYVAIASNIKRGANIFHTIRWRQWIVQAIIEQNICNGHSSQFLVSWIFHLNNNQCGVYSLVLPAIWSIECPFCTIDQRIDLHFRTMSIRRVEYRDVHFHYRDQQM